LLPNIVLRRRCCWAPAPAAVDRYLGAQQQTRRVQLLLSNDGKQTDKWTLDRFTDPAASHTMPAVSVMV